jgi:hypothetical protein
MKQTSCSVLIGLGSVNGDGEGFLSRRLDDPVAQVALSFGVHGAATTADISAQIKGDGTEGALL